MTVTSLFTSMAGLQEITAQMQATASNLANLQTPGYNAIQAQALAAPYSGANAPPGADVVALVPGPDTSAGPLVHTGNPLDVAVHGQAWLAVQQPDGTTALTRDGSLAINNAGLLTTSDGSPILGAGGSPISVPNLAKLEIGADGTVSGVPASTPGAPAQNYGKIRLVQTPSGPMQDIGNSLFTPPAGVALQDAPTASLAQNYLNGSNVDETQSMITLLSDSRSYQTQTQLMKTQVSGGDSLNTLLAQG
jgi:flagellar basal-body rod protein FlgF